MQKTRGLVVLDDRPSTIPGPSFDDRASAGEFQMMTVPIGLLSTHPGAAQSLFIKDLEGSSGPEAVTADAAGLPGDMNCRTMWRR